MSTVQKVSWWHERLADWMIANPDKRLKDAAVFFDCTASYIYMLKNSDAFKEYWDKRSTEASNINDANTILAKTAAVADIAMEKLLDKLSSPADVLQAPFLLEVADTAMRRLGYGTKPVAPPPAGGNSNVKITIGLVSAAQLADAREKMRKLHGVEPSAQFASLHQAEALLQDVAVDVEAREGEVLPPAPEVKHARQT